MAGSVHLPAFMLSGPACQDPHRWIDLRNPYIGFSHGPHCLEQWDPNPRTGEVGLGMFYDTGEDLAGWGSQWTITKPNGTTCYRYGCVDDTSVQLISDDMLFTAPGLYRIQATLCRSGRIWPLPCLQLYVIC